MRALIGVDVGGTGSRAVLAAPGGWRREVTGDGARVGADGADALATASALVRSLAEAHDGPIAGVGIGATGLATLVTPPGDALGQLAQVVRAPVAAATDALTAHLGALGGSGGAVVAVGTGAVALGTDLGSHAVRIDGWGHLLGDRGSGTWIGMEALRAATLAHDGVDDAGRTLLTAMRAQLGDVVEWPARLYLADDRAGVMARLVPSVARLALAGDPSASAILERAADAIGDTLVAALAPPTPQRAAVTGGVLSVGDWFVARVRSRVEVRRPGVQFVKAEGTPLDGALTLARLAAARRVPRVPGCWHAR